MTRLDDKQQFVIQFDVYEVIGDLRRRQAHVADVVHELQFGLDCNCRLVTCQICIVLDQFKAFEELVAWQLQKCFSLKKNSF
jgi:hypothetical protein